jgi:hypothetical protein
MAVLPGEGTLLQIESVTPGTYTTIGQRVSIGGPGISVEPVETTHLDSTWKAFRPSKVPDGGEVSMQLEYDPEDAVHIIILGHLTTPPTTLPNWRIVFNNGTGTRKHYQFAGFPTEWSPTGMEVEGNLLADVTIKVSGAITVGTTTIP